MIFCLLLLSERAPGYEQRQPRSGGKRVSAALRMARAELRATAQSQVDLTLAAAAKVKAPYAFFGSFDLA